ncbi:hypothetical protein GCM10023322_80320 [Rugosimonospora acidiphila]|uniref:Lipoprotein n=1 Tax=Rugosimonospora acidiphila TaxID=556531 RepID=A0ABP9SRT8_9ACTN
MRLKAGICGVLLGISMLATGCAETSLGLSCAHGNCQVDLRDGSSVTLAGHQVKVLRVDSASLTLLAGGARFMLDEKTDINIGSLHLHLERLRGGVATVDVSS